MKLDLYKTDGTKTGTQVTLQPEIFNIEPSDHSIWLDVTAEQTNKRQGTASTKNRSAVRGGGRKPFKQKGRGTARAGTIRSPLWVGGGRIFGPTPHPFGKGVNRKMSRLARKSALSYRAREKQICLVEDFSLDQAKTKELYSIFQKLNIQDKKTLVLTSDHQTNVWLSGRNIPGVQVRPATGFSTLDVMKANMLLIQKGAIEKINEVFTK